MPLLAPATNTVFPAEAPLILGFLTVRAGRSIGGSAVDPRTISCGGTLTKPCVASPTSPSTRCTRSPTMSSDIAATGCRMVVRAG